MYRRNLSMNRGWRFFRGAAPAQRREDGGRGVHVWETAYDDSAWEAAVLPHTAREEALMCSGGRNYQGECWYRRRFAIPEECAGLDMYIELEAAMQRVDAWLDGEPLGVRMGGFLPMAFDLTGIAAGVEHVLALRVDNSDMADVPPGKPQGALDFCYFGGLYRDAWLRARHSVHFTEAVHAGRAASGGLFARFPEVSAGRAVVTVDAHFENRGAQSENVRVELLLDGETVWRGEQAPLAPGEERVERASFAVEKPRLWHPHHPHLYTLTARLLRGGETLDEVRERVGVRRVEFRPEGFFINGEKLFLNGANRHQEYPYVGFALPDSVQRRDVRLLRDCGVVSIRLGHYPQDRAFMDACDEMGVLCVIPTPGWQIHPESVLFDERSFENTRRLIRMNRNHPSACLWEPILNETDYPEYFAKKQLEIVREEMGDGDAWCACDSHYAYAERYPVVYSHSPCDGGEARPRYVREYGDNWTEQFGPMTTLRRVRRGERTGFYTGGEKAMLRSAQERFEAYALLRMDGRLAGAAMWAGIDHNRGYEESEGAVGMLDLQRLPKLAYHLYDAQQDMALAGPKCFIAGDWAEGPARDVHVYTNAPAARLSLNGRKIGTLTAREGWANAHVYDARLRGRELPEAVHPPIVFKSVPWERGVLRAEALLDGRAVACCEARAPGEARRVVLRPQWAGENAWIADGSDLLLVHAFIVDEDGTPVHAAEPEVRFGVTGPAGLVGDGEEWVRANPMRAEAGVASALLRAGAAPGRVVLRAEAEGLEAGEIALETAPDPREHLPGPACEPPAQRPVYAVDRRERFSVPQSLKLEPWFRLDIGRDKPARASSAREGAGPENINRGRADRPWIAAGPCPQWWQVDLGEIARTPGITVKWLSDGLWYEYAVDVSEDGAAWTRAAAGRASGQSYLPVRFEGAIPARWIRVRVLSVTGGEAPGMLHVEVHGEGRG